jgi:hypothetical protein
MEIADVLAQAGGIQAIARQLGIDEGQAASGAAALLPAILGGFRRQAQTHPEGVEGLGGILAQLGGTGLLQDVLAPQGNEVARGNDILGQIFGSPEVSRTVAQGAASRSGVDPSVLKRMLPLLAMLVAGYLSSHHAGGAAPPPAQPAGGLGGLLGGLLGGSAGGGGLASVLDMNGDGNPLDDLLQMAGRAMR